MTRLSGSGRYAALDELLGSRSDSERILTTGIEEFLLEQHPCLRDRMQNERIDVVFAETRTQLVLPCLQRLTRALCRTYTLGLLGDRRRQLKSVVRPFLNRRDHQLTEIPPLGMSVQPGQQQRW